MVSVVIPMERSQTDLVLTGLLSPSPRNDFTVSVLSALSRKCAMALRASVDRDRDGGFLLT